MPLSNILRQNLDSPRMTLQEVADQALTADQEARRLYRAGDPRAAAADDEAAAIAREFDRRAGA
jgi:hypothetical protein